MQGSPTAFSTYLGTRTCSSHLHQAEAAPPRRIINNIFRHYGPQNGLLGVTTEGTLSAGLWPSAGSAKCGSSAFQIGTGWFRGPESGGGRAAFHLAMDRSALWMWSKCLAAQQHCLVCTFGSLTLESFAVCTFGSRPSPRHNCFQCASGAQTGCTCFGFGYAQGPAREALELDRGPACSSHMGFAAWARSTGSQSMPPRVRGCMPVVVRSGF